jgi:hypothetical protein
VKETYSEIPWSNAAGKAEGAAIRCSAFKVMIRQSPFMAVYLLASALLAVFGLLEAERSPAAVYHVGLRQAGWPCPGHLL